MGSNLGNFTDFAGGDSSSGDSDDQDLSQNDTSDDLTDLEESIDDLEIDSDGYSQQDGLSMTGSSESETVLVEIAAESFMPVHADIAVGDTVMWRNTTDQSQRVSGVEEEDLQSPVLEPEEEFSFTFDEEERAVVYSETLDTPTKYGSVMVGDVDRPALPTNVDTDVELFTGQDGSRTLSAAAEEKEQMDIGF